MPETTSHQLVVFPLGSEELAGAMDFVVKPVQPDRVIDAVGGARLDASRRLSCSRPASRRAFVVLGGIRLGLDG